ncbi:hypothetical protein ACROYT_G034118 [Oculina patagonica]
MKDLKIVDIVTDASNMIIALVRSLKEQNPSDLAQLFHSLDIWHKSCKLTAKLTAAAKVKGCEDIAQWIEPIRNHFWYCAEQCDGDEETLRDMWLGVLHHICGEHEWWEGKCSHGPLVSTEDGKTFLQMDSKAHKAVRDIVADRHWLKSLAFYVKFRHTSKLECFNSMMLKYAPKRITFSYDVFVARVLLAALDHNFNLYREDVSDSSGQVQYKRKYSKRSKNWRAEPVKEGKKYPHWPLLAAKILQKRAINPESIVQRMEIPTNHPKRLAATIAMKDAPATKDLVKDRLSRFSKKCIPE